MTLSYINSRTINHDVIYSYTLLYGFNQQLTNPFSLFESKGANPQKDPHLTTLEKIIRCEYFWGLSPFTYT